MKNSKTFKKLDIKEQNEKLESLFYDKILEVEKEKLIYFILTYDQKVVIGSGNGNKEELEEFLGYKINGRRGHAGIQVLSRGSKLYNISGNLDNTKVNTYIYKNMLNQQIEINDEIKKYLNYKDLSSLFEFDAYYFSKIINLEPIKKFKKEKFNCKVEKLGKICNIKIGGTPSRYQEENFVGGKYNWLSIKEMEGKIIEETKEKITDKGVESSNVKLVKKGTTLVSFKLTIGKTAIAGIDLYTNEAIAALEISESYKNKIRDKYLFNLFNAKYIDLSTSNNKSFGKSLNSKFLKNLSIPMPSIKIQDEINEAIEILDTNDVEAKRNVFNVYLKNSK